jgi:hypothetical protein
MRMASENKESNPIISMLADCSGTGLLAFMAVIFIPSISHAIISDPVWMWVQTISIGIFGLALVCSLIAATSVIALIFGFVFEGILVISGNLMIIFAFLGTILYGVFVVLNWTVWCIRSVMA